MMLDESSAVRFRKLSNAPTLHLIAVACIVLVPAQAVWCQQTHPHNHHRQYQKQVEALEQQWRQAELDRDANALDKMLADDYIGITANGTLQTKEQTLARMRTGQLVLKQLDLSEVKVSVHGETAVVTSRADVQSIQNGEERDGVFRYTRVYQLRDGAWKIVNFEGTRINPRANSAAVGPGAMTIDGSSETASPSDESRDSTTTQSEAH